MPFAQIRSSGVYGPILEKCTETEPRRRFPTIAALRAALFDLWRTTRFEAAVPGDANVLEAVLNNPTSTDGWRRLIAYGESLPRTERHALLSSINAELLQHLNSADDALFSRLMRLICEWAEGQDSNGHTATPLVIGSLKHTALARFEFAARYCWQH